MSKFLYVARLRALLDHQARAPEPRLGEFLLLTLDNRVRPGLRDPVNGGFIESELLRDGQLLKSRVGKDVFADAELNDYAYLAQGLLDHADAFDDAGSRALATHSAIPAPWEYCARGSRRSGLPPFAKGGRGGFSR